MNLSALADQLVGHPLRVLASTPSTNDALAEWVAEGAPHGAIVIARRQTKGRGRRGRRWFADPEGSLAMSIWLAAKMPAARALSLPLVIGLALWRALSRFRNDLRLKWPNDVLSRNGEKLAGVLVEAKKEGFIVGIGVNVRTPKAGWPKLDQPATALDAHGARPTRREVAEAIVQQIDLVFDCWQKEGFAALKQAWWQAHGGEQRVRVRTGTELVIGTAIGLGDDGALLVAARHGIRRITLGDVEAIG